MIIPCKTEKYNAAVLQVELCLRSDLPTGNNLVKLAGSGPKSAYKSDFQ